MLWLCNNTLTLVCYGIEVLLQMQLALPARSFHPATSSVHWLVLIQTFLQCNYFLLLHTYHLSLTIPTQSQLCSGI